MMRSRGAMLLLLVAVASMVSLTGAAEAEEKDKAVLAPAGRARGKALVACTQVVKKRWSQTVDELQEQVQKMIQVNITLNTTTAGRKLAEIQLASCIENIREDDVGEVNANTLNITRVKEILGDEKAVFSEDDMDYLTKAMRGEMYEGDAPSIMGVAVHNVPLPLQLMYIVIVGACIVWLVAKLVTKLTHKEVAQQSRKEKKASSKQN